MDVYTKLLRPSLFRVDPEIAHGLALRLCVALNRMPFVGRVISRRLSVVSPVLQSHVAGISFSNPVALAAGWDKSGLAHPFLGQMGFGYVEIGSVSARPSAGNPRPRLFRLPDDQAIVVNYGLPNDGAERVARRLATNRSPVPLGINIVSTNDEQGQSCSTEAILEDYLTSIRLLQGYASYLMLNLSCPNVHAGADLFIKGSLLRELLLQLAAIHVHCPVFLKLPPTMDAELIDVWLETVTPFPQVQGFMFNLPRGKPDSLQFVTPAGKRTGMPGAVAGRPVGQLMRTCIGQLYQQMPPDRFVIIGAGGIFAADEAYRMIQSGASLLQIYSALIYSGPSVVRRINRGLVNLLTRDGFTNVQQAVGSAHRQ